MKNNVIKFTVNPFTSLENIMKKVNNAAEGKIIDGIFVERKSFFKSEVEVLLSAPQPIIKTVEKEVIKKVPVEVIKEVEVIKTVPSTEIKGATVVTAKKSKGSKYRGVTKNRNRYYARIAHDGKSKFLGSFGSEIDAARAYNKAAKELHGLDAILNIIDIDTPVAN